VSIEFPLLRKNTPLGTISDPKIPVGVRTLAGYRTYHFVIDTGADFSVAPKRLARQVGLDWTTLLEAKMTGIEQGGVSARLGSLPISVHGIELTVRCLFVDAPKSLFLLGRPDFLDRFVVTMNQPAQKIILVPVS